MSRRLVYTLHLWPPIAHAKHYTGSAMERQLARRLTDHALGRGARLTQVQVERGGSWVLAQTEPGGRTEERRLKQHGAARRCGVCKAADGYQSGQLTAAEALTRAGWDRASQHERGLLLGIFGLSQAPENLPAQPGPRPEMPAPRPGPASGEVRVIPAPRPAPDAHYQITPEVVALVGQLEAAWAAEREAAPQAAAGFAGTGGRVVSDLHHRSTLDDAFCEWLLSDHPDAKAERDWRRGTHLRQLRESAAEIAAWADRVSAEPEQHTPMARDLAGTIGPMAHASALRAEIEEAEPDDAYVARQRADFESHMRWDHPDYRYPAHLTGPSAASYPPPPEPEPEAGP